MLRPRWPKPRKPCAPPRCRSANLPAWPARRRPIKLRGPRPYRRCARQASAAAELHRITVARDNLAIEEQRIQDATDQSRQRLEQIAKDRERAIAFAADATSTVKRLSAEQGEIDTTRSAETEERTAAAEALAAANTQVEETETALNTATALVADIDAQRNGLTHRIGDLEQRLDRMTRRAEEIERQRAELDADQQDNTTVDEAERAVASCAVAVEAALDQQREAEETRTATEQALRRANAAFRMLTPNWRG